MVNTASPTSSSSTSSSPSSGGEALITATSLSKTYDGIQDLFQNLDVVVSRGQKVGLLGANGTGKSTLLKVLAGVETSDKGLVQIKKGLRIGYLAQDPVLDESLSILDAVLAADTPVMRAVRRYENALQALKGTAVKQAQAEQDVQAAMDEVAAMDAWDVASEAEKLLEILGVGSLADENRTVAELSGGQKKRVALAATLLSKPDLIILDEPTNHMDVRVIQWMEKTLSDPSLTVVLVTHDRYFLDAVCNQVIELDGGRGYRHSGNYSSFLANRQQRLADEEAAISRAENTLRKEAEWMRRQPKARSTKSKSRIDRFYALTEKAKRRSTGPALELEVGESRVGSKILAMVNATAVRGEKVIFEGFSYRFDKGERVGVVGRNGAGKSTFLDVVAGALPLLEGTRDTGETLVLGYYTQQTPPIPDDIRVIDYVRSFGETVQLGTDSGGWNSPSTSSASSGSGETITASSLLERFGFPRTQQYNWAGRLSGGQKRRLYLATVLMRRPNFLLLDEPTNDLDLPTIETLEKFLESFEGCLLVASHDRAFMDNVASRLFVLEGDGDIQLFEGTYSEYMQAVWQREKEASKEKAQDEKPMAVAKKEGSSIGLTYMEKKEFSRLEKEIEGLNGKRVELEALLMKDGSSADFASLAKLADKLAFIQKSIEEKTDRWLELAEKEDAS